MTSVWRESGDPGYEVLMGLTCKGCHEDVRRSVAFGVRPNARLMLDTEDSLRGAWDMSAKEFADVASRVRGVFRDRREQQESPREH